MTTIIEKRLSKLPSKVSAPFRELLARELISSRAVETILDAGELAGNSTQLLGFAIAYLNLQTQGVPIDDVIRMAKSQGRTIGLSWSAVRWRQEHERLSRAATLSRLAETNTSYDVSRFERHLPRKFAGYLIRSSRRLGMEGLRQRHCVASYDAQLRRGNTAIACVFVEKTRWTVELHKTDNIEGPLIVRQVRSRFNGNPTPDVLERIHAVLGIDWNPPLQANRAIEGYGSYLAKLRRLLPLLRESGVQRVLVDFNGEADSGAIESIVYLPQESEALAEASIETVKSMRSFSEGQWTTISETVQVPIDEVIDDIANDYLQETGVDWYNDDGGFGQLIIDVERDVVSLKIEVRETTSWTEYSRGQRISTGEEIEFPN